MSPLDDANGTFILPIFFDFGACFCFALTGAWAATARGYDLLGAFVLAFVTGLGGGLIRDSFLLSTRPVVLQDSRYLFVVLAATKEKKIISETNVGAALYGTPIVANGTIYIQSNTHLFAFSDPTKAGMTKDEPQKLDVQLKK